MNLITPMNWYDLLSEHKFDIGFVYQHLHYKNIIAEQIFEEKLYLVQSEHPVIPRAQVHTDELDSSMELFLSWDDNFQIWHDRWLSSVTRPHISADTITLLDRLWKKDENWMIAPESVIQEPFALPFSVCQRTGQHPAKPCLLQNPASLSQGFQQALLLNILSTSWNIFLKNGISISQSALYGILNAFYVKTERKLPSVLICVIS